MSTSPEPTAHPLDPLRDGAGAIIDVLDALHSGALLLTTDGLIVHANRRFTHMSQRPRHELIGRLLTDFYDTDGAREKVRACLSDPSGDHEREFYIVRPDGSRLPVVVSSSSTSNLGPSPLRIATFIDLTPQKEIQGQLREQFSQVSKLTDVVLEQALELKNYNKTLEKRVRQRTRDLHDANMDAIVMLAIASEAKDEDTGAHVRRIEGYSRLLARTIGLPDEEAERLGYSAILHDVGKIHVPDEILKKPGPLTPDERRVMEEHTLAGERILLDKPFFQLAREIARSHQENWDGSGYPDHRARLDIPLAARIVRLADVYDALSSRRVYKPPWPEEQVIETILRGREREFDPELVDAFRTLLERGDWRVASD